MSQIPSCAIPIGNKGGGSPAFALSNWSEILGGAFLHQIVHTASEHK